MDILDITILDITIDKNFIYKGVLYRKSTPNYPNIICEIKSGVNKGDFTKIPLFTDGVFTQVEPA